MGDDQNWVRQLFVSYEHSDELTINVGRLFLAAPRATPPPFLLKSARYMRYPVNAFGYGAQVVYQDNGWSVVFDVTGAVEPRFNQGGHLDRMASSARVTYQVSSGLTVGGTYQVSEDINRFSVEATIRPDDSSLLNIVAYTTNSLDGGWAFYERRIGNDLWAHAMVDLQSGGDSRTTLGLRHDFGRFRFVVDYELEREEAFGRFQARF